VGFVVHLNYENPHLFPYMEFQRFKHHPMVAELLKGGKRVAYGARAISEGGWQSMPKGRRARCRDPGLWRGLVNVPRIKGNHNAMLSGIEAAEAAHAAIGRGTVGDELTAYDDDLHKGGPIAKDLKPVRNVKPLWSKYGLLGGVVLGGSTCGWAASPAGTRSARCATASRMPRPPGKARNTSRSTIPKPDGVLSFDRLTNVSFSMTNHEESQPAHLTLKDAASRSVNLPEYAEPAQRYCPAGVYEVVEEDRQGPRFVINFQNCVHCKTCDIKDPSQNIHWTVPQGGDGPNYPEHVTRRGRVRRADGGSGPVRTRVAAPRPRARCGRRFRGRR
jgi:electron-transferring-flavoprotein dehydrogenase